MLQKHLATLELPKVLERLVRECSFSASADLARELAPDTELVEVQRRLEETAQARAALTANDMLSIGGARDVRDLTKRAARGSVLDASEFLEIRDTLLSARNVQRAMRNAAAEYPRLHEITQFIDPLDEIADAIQRTIDERGEVRDNASPTLSKLRSEIRIAHDRLMQKLQRMVSDSGNSGTLQEAIITQRNGRYVIPVKSDFKGRIPGVVHDQSSSGQTLFIEPLATLELNNTWRELQIAEQNEVHRILAALSGRIGSERETIIRDVEALALFDLALAKAKLADRMRAVAAAIHTNNKKTDAITLSITQARHPLLDVENVVPIDVTLNDKTRVLVITGPNTGGKTVAMKTIGLFVAMTQCGLCVPAQAAQLPVFEAIYADIGDEQSIEQSLSTFSAHLTNLVSFLDRVNENSLVLLDELGSGTDPIEGAALARAMLDYLLNSGAICVVATHYAELKAWASLTEGAANANVAFDVKTLRPLYKLTIGLPGKSNAFAIAQRLGVPSAILDVAQQNMDTDHLRAEDMLAQIAQMQRQVQAARDAARRAERAAESNSDKLRTRLSQIDQERKKLLEEAREDALREVEELRAEVRKLRARVVAAGGSIDIVKDIEREVEIQDAEIKRQESEIKAQKIEAPKTVKRRLQVGDTVHIKTLNADGEIAGLNGDEADVQIGRLRTRVRLSQLTFVKREDAEKRKREEATQSAYQAASAPSPGMELDMRGMLTDEGVKTVEDYLDRAHRAGLPFVRIIHGKGTGALRRAVREAIKNHAAVKSFETGTDGEGGDGVTVVKLHAD
jgi:DNA mismatch repair protein MutS2